MKSHTAVLVEKAQEDVKRFLRQKDMFGALPAFETLFLHVLTTPLDSKSLDSVIDMLKDARAKLAPHRDETNIWLSWPGMSINKIVGLLIGGPSVNFCWHQGFDMIERSLGREELLGFLSNTNSRDAFAGPWWSHYIEDSNTHHLLDAVCTRIAEEPIPLARHFYITKAGGPGALRMHKFVTNRLENGLEPTSFLNASAHISRDFWQAILASESKKLPPFVPRELLEHLLFHRAFTFFEDLLRTPALAQHLFEHSRFRSTQPFWPADKKEGWFALLESSRLKQSAGQVEPAKKTKRVL
jgi:hypothetical protein